MFVNVFTRPTRNIFRVVKIFFSMLYFPPLITDRWEWRNHQIVKEGRFLQSVRRCSKLVKKYDQENTAENSLEKHINQRMRGTGNTRFFCWSIICPFFWRRQTTFRKTNKMNPNLFKNKVWYRWKISAYYKRRTNL